MQKLLQSTPRTWLLSLATYRRPLYSPRIRSLILYAVMLISLNAAVSQVRAQTFIEPPVIGPPVEPPITVPPLSEPPVNVPPPTVPPVSAPPVDVPPLTIPSLNIPPIVPPVFEPPIFVPPINVPPDRVPPVFVSPTIVPPLAARFVNVPPVIVQQPRDQLDVPIGTSVRFEVVAQGRGNLRYQWRQNGIPLRVATANQSILIIPNVAAFHAGVYDVLVSDDAGFVISEPARLTLLLPVGQLSDNFLDRTRRPVSELAGLVRFNNLNATREPSEPLHDDKQGQHSVWMTWIAPAVDGIAHFETRASGFDTLLAVYQGESLVTLTRGPSDDDSDGATTSSVRFKVQPRGTYHIAVDGRARAAGDIVLAWSFEPTTDTVALITRHPRGQSAALGDTVRLTLEHNLPNAQVQWFHNGQPIPGGQPLPVALGSVLTISDLTLDKAGAYRALVRTVGRTIRDIPSKPARVQLNALEGRSRSDVFTEDKFSDLVDPTSFVGPARAEPELSATRRRAWALHSDRFRPLSAPARGYSGTQIFSTVGSTSEPGEPAHCGVTGGASEWYAIQAESNGFLSIDTMGSNFDTVLAVYTDPGGTGTLEGLVEGPCNNDLVPGSNLQSAVTFACTSGVIYYAAVDGVNGATGTGVLHYFLNRLPTIPDLPNTTLNEDASSPAIPFTIGDAETTPANLRLTVDSSNPSLVPLSNIVLGGSGAARTLTIGPAPNQNGSATISVTVADGHGASASDSIVLTVNPGNDPPTLDSIGDLVLNQNPGPQVVGLTGISTGAPDETQVLAVNATSSNPALIPTPGVTYSSPNATGTLSFTPVTGASGFSVISVTVNDGASENASFTRTFTVTVAAAANQAPVAQSQSISMLKNGVQPITLTASDGDGNSLSYAIVVNPIQGALTGTPPNVTYTPSPDFTGSDSFTFIANDGSLDSTPAVLSITITEPQPIKFTSVKLMAGGLFLFNLTAAPGNNCLLESSTDLKNWTVVVALSNPTGTMTYFDPVVANQRLYYRAKLAP